MFVKIAEQYSTVGGSSSTHNRTKYTSVWWGLRTPLSRLKLINHDYNMFTGSNICGYNLEVRVPTKKALAVSFRQRVCLKSSHILKPNYSPTTFSNVSRRNSVASSALNLVFVDTIWQCFN